MRLKYKSKFVELERSPASFENLCSLVQTYFKVHDPVLIIRDDTGFYQVNSSAEFMKINHRNIQEIKVQDPINSIANHLNMIGINNNTSIETTSSHEKSESEESKKIDHLKSEETYTNQEGIHECVGLSYTCAESTTQTDQIFYKEISTGRDSKISKDFSCQFDTKLKFEVNELEELMKNEIMYIKYCIKQQAGICHKEIKCNTCHLNPIIGARYEC